MATPKFQNGDWVKVEFEGKSFEGTVIPSPNQAVLQLKLKSGYNAGFPLNKAKIQKISQGKKAQKPPSKPTVENPALPMVSILHTGGTIASRVDYASGAVTTGFNSEDLLTMFPELSQKANFSARFLSSMFSENMRFAQISRIAKEIENELKSKPAGIIVSHGTDTMAYTAAALSFMIENPAVPILLVGAQRSSDRGSSDAAVNLLCAVDFILNSDFAGVAICMHENENDSACAILPPTKTRKLHTSRRDAFQAVNAKPIASVSNATGSEKPKIDFFSSEYLRKNHGKETIFRTKLEEKIAILKSHPNLFPEQISVFEKNKFAGLILEGTGMGHFPIEVTDEFNKKNADNLKALKSLAKKGCVIGMTSQCIFGAVQLHVYSAGVKLAQTGVISGNDMLSETALIKLSWLLGNFPKKDVSKLFQENLRGEIQSRLPLDAKAPRFEA